MTSEGYATFEDLDSQYGPLIDHEIQLDLADFVWRNNIEPLSDLGYCHKATEEDDSHATE